MYYLQRNCEENLSKRLAENCGANYILVIETAHFLDEYSTLLSCCVCHALFNYVTCEFVLR